MLIVRILILNFEVQAGILTLKDTCFSYLTSTHVKPQRWARGSPSCYVDPTGAALRCYVSMFLFDVPLLHLIT